jgi:hypothetical protein
MTEGFVADRPEFEWLTEKAGGWQFGEQGILVALANAINKPGQCVEIGAGNGESLPLTIDPFYQYGLPCVLFEADEESLSMLKQRYPLAENLGMFLGFGMNGHAIENVLLVVVIDVDGNDSFIMNEVLSDRAPHILMVEHFDKMHPNHTPIIDEPVPSWLLGERLIDGFSIQDNAETLRQMALKSNYTRLGTTRVNSIFVHDSLVEKVAKHVPS